MDKQTEGIVLKQLKYSESSIIVKIYTLDFGIQSYIVKGVRKKSKKNLAVLFQPLTHLELSSFNYKKSDLNIYKEGKNIYLFKSIHTHPIKMTLTFFISEVLLATLREESSNPELYNFVSQSIQFLDEEQNYANFHIWFMLNLTKFLGFFPNTELSEGVYFNLTEGGFVREESTFTCTLEESIFVKKFLKSSLNECLDLKLNKLNRQTILDIIIKYYNLQNHTISNLNSLKIVQEVIEIL